MVMLSRIRSKDKASPDEQVKEAKRKAVADSYAEGHDLAALVKPKSKPPVEELDDDDDFYGEDLDPIELANAEAREALANDEDDSYDDYDSEDDDDYLEEVDSPVHAEVNDPFATAADGLTSEEEEALANPVQVEEVEIAEDEPVKTQDSNTPAPPPQPNFPQRDVVNTSAFQQIKAEVPSAADISFAQMIESMIMKQCELSGVSNLDLTTFGLRAQYLHFQTLEVMEYGIHKFLGVPFSREEQDSIIHEIGVHVALSQEKRIVLQAVKPIVDEQGLTFYSLQFDAEIAQRFADAFRYKVYMNQNEADISKLVLVIDK